MTDPIADFLTRIRNAVSVGHKVVEIPGSKMKLEMTKILKEKGYIWDIALSADGSVGIIFEEESALDGGEETGEENKEENGRVRLLIVLGC